MSSSLVVALLAVMSLNVYLTAMHIQQLSAMSTSCQQSTKASGIALLNSQALIRDLRALLLGRHGSTPTMTRADMTTSNGNVKSKQKTIETEDLSSILSVLQAAGDGDTVLINVKQFKENWNLVNEQRRDAKKVAPLPTQKK